MEEDDYADSVDEEEYLEIDSPMEPRPDEFDEDEELQDGANLLGPAEHTDATLPAFSSAPPKLRQKIKLPKEDRQKMLDYPRSLPYECESLDEFDQRLALIQQRLLECVQTKDYDIGFLQWNHRLQCLISLQYPILRSTRASLASLYYHIVLVPGLDARLVDVAAQMAISLLQPRRKISIRDLTLPWRPLHEMLHRQLFPKTRQTGLTGLSNTLMDLAATAQRFFPPSEAEAILEKILPDLDGSNINSVIAVQAFLVHFLPLSQPQRWLPAMFKLWATFESGMFDDQMLDLLARLTVLHCNPDGAVPQKLRGEHKAEPRSTDPNGEELWSDIGLLTHEQFSLVMTKALRSAGLPVGSTKDANAVLMAQSAGIRTGSDAEANGTVLSMKKPTNRTVSIATIIVHSMMNDAPVAAEDAEGSTSSSEDASTRGPSGQSSPLGRPTSTTAAEADLPKKPAGTANEQTHFLAGCRALDAFNRFLQATETYFHPSNWGPWQYALSSLVAEASSVFLRRWKEERRSDCKTPVNRRLTPEIKRKFVAAVRGVCFLCMFSKDVLSLMSCQAALKRLVLLEPELIIPPILERAYPGLEELETTHRTTAIITTLRTLAPVLVTRDAFSPGGKHLLPLLQLCLPAIDPTDFAKTLCGCAFIVSAVTTIRLDDLTRPEMMPATDADASQLDSNGTEESEAAQRRDDDDALRMSTASVEEWLTDFFGRTFAVFASLPEEGAKGKVGGKQEDQVSASLLSAVEAVISSLSKHLLQQAWDVVLRHISDTVTPSSSKLMASLVASFARADADMVLAKLVPLADARLRLEIKYGASSTRTTSTYTAAPGDAAFHWHLLCLGGAVMGSGKAVLRHKKTLMELLQYLVAQTRSERGFSLLGRLVGRLLQTLLGIYPHEWHPFNPDEWNDPEVQKQAHLHWGKVYEAKDVQISWHIPCAEEIAFVMEVIEQIVEPALEELAQMQDVESDRRDKVWSNDFCRKLGLVRHAFTSLANAVQDTEQEGGAPASDIGDECMEFVKAPARFQSGFILTDPTSPAYQLVVRFRARCGDVLYRCATSTKASEAEDKQDCIKLLLRSVRTYVTDYAYDAADYQGHAHTLDWYRSVYKVHPRQKKFPRSLWLRRAAWYHHSRGRMNSFYRQRSPLYDKLLLEVVLEYCMSTYVGIRQLAQRTLDKMASLYDGSRQLCFGRLLATIRPGALDDQVKGALYVLGSKGFSSIAVIDPRFTAEYVLCLLKAQHHPKPSLQKLVRGLLNDFCVRFIEPSTLKYDLETPAELIAFASETEASLRSSPQAPAKSDVLAEVAARRQARIDGIQRVHDRLVPEVMAIGLDSATHWSFALYAARLLRSMIRRDQPLSKDVAQFFIQQLHADNPVMRKYATGALTKILFFAKVRTLSKSPEDLVFGKTTNPLKVKGSADVAGFQGEDSTPFGCFMRPLVPGQTRLLDRSALGWLAWGSNDLYYQLPDRTEPPWQWEEASRPALDALWQSFKSSDWWDKQLEVWAQEKQRNYTAHENQVFMKSVAQVFGGQLVSVLGAAVERYIGERDRHKHRAAAEVLIGLLRGSKHWPLDDQDQFWAWFTPLLPRIFKEATQDSQPVWEDMISQAFDGRDPRRAMPLLTFVVDRLMANLRTDGSEPEDSLQMQSRAHSFFRCLVYAADRKLTVRRNPWIDAHGKSFDVAFSEIRALLSDNLASLELFSVAPSFASVDSFLRSATRHTAAIEAGGEQPRQETNDITEHYAKRFASLRDSLAVWKEERIPTSQGSSKYDNASLTALLWISTTLGDHRKSAMAAFAIDFLPSIFEMLELKDNRELSKLARAALTRISTHHYGPGPLPSKLLRTLLDIMSGSKEWRMRLDALPILQVAYFQNLFYLGPADIREIVDVLLALLKDPHLEVREMAATTLSGVVRCSQRKLISDLKRRFTAAVVASTPVPKRGQPGFHETLASLHSGILGSVALLTAFPYDVPSWMPSLLIETVCQHTESPPPVSNTVKKCAAEWRRTHQDNWNEVVAKLTEEELQEVNMWVLGRSDYYA
ncbi:unnamed protein product [Parajaminaea phylloscopi]